VTVIDRVSEQDSSGCSYINCGYLTPSHFIPLAAPGVVKKGLKWMFNSKSPLYIKPRLNAELINWLWYFNKSATQKNVDRTQGLLLEMNLLSRDLYQELHANELDFEFGRKGLLTVCQTEKGMQAEIGVQKAGAELGLDVQILDQEAVHLLEPEMAPYCIGGSMIAADGHVQPGEFMMAMKKWLVDNEVEFQWGKEVVGIEGNSIQLYGDESIVSDQLVLAGGSWSSLLVKNLGLKMPLQSGKGYSMTLQNLPVNLKHPTVLSEAKIALTPFENALRVGGTMEIAGLDLSISQGRVEAIKEATCAFLPEVKRSWFEGIQVERGLRPVSPDGMPFISRLEKSPNVIVAAGHGMMGMSLGPVTGKLVEGLVSEFEPVVSMEQLKVERFG
jgi:D-amino-acid dehydrogenase